MTLRLFSVLALLGVVGCQKSAPPPAAAATPAAEAAKLTNEPKSGVGIVELDASAQSQAGIKVETLQSRSIPQVLRANGRLTMNENTTWRVGALTEGRIIQVDSKVGDVVAKGAILARMHSHDIHESRSQYRRAHAEFDRMKANEEFAHRQRDRMKRLYDLKAASLEQLDHAENEWKNARVAVENADNEMTRTRMHLVEYLQVPIEGPEEHGHESDPEVHVEDLIPVRAPASGVVVTRNVTPGAVVSASSDLFVISDLATIWVIASVQEESLSRVKVGMPARVFVQAWPETPFMGRIQKIGEVLDPTTRTLSVRVEIPNKGGRLKPEMYASVELEAGGSESAVFIPQSATQDVNGQTSVFVRKDASHFEVRAVELGRTIDSLVQVVRGLQAGEAVVTQGAFTLKAQLLKASMAEE